MPYLDENDIELDWENISDKLNDVWTDPDEDEAKPANQSVFHGIRVWIADRRQRQFAKRQNAKMLQEFKPHDPHNRAW